MSLICGYGLNPREFAFGKHRTPASGGMDSRLRGNDALCACVWVPAVVYPRVGGGGNDGFFNYGYNGGVIVYLHGFNSSPLSSKGVLMAEFCAAAGVECVVPQLPHRPADAIALVRGLLDERMQDAANYRRLLVREAQAEVPNYDNANRLMVVGSSMGGYYAAYLCAHYANLRAVLINPAVKLADKLAGEVGRMQKNYHNDEEYLFTEEHLREFAALDVVKLPEPSRCLLMVQKGDEVLDYREAVEFYDGARMVVEEGGDHSFVGFADHLQRILDFHRWVE